MKSIVYIFILLPILTFCATPSSETFEANVVNYIAEDDLTKYRYVLYDWDKNGVKDKFEFDNYNEDVVIDFNGTTYRFSTTSTVYQIFTEPSALKYNQISDSAFIFLKLNSETEALLLKDRGDFSGPVLDLWTYGKDNSGEIKKIWSGEGAFTEIADLDDTGSLEIVLEDIQSEPGYIKEYEFVTFTFFRVYTFSNNEMVLDSLLTQSYNLKHRPLFEETVGMKKPVLARNRQSDNSEFELVVDLAEIE